MGVTHVTNSNQADLIADTRAYLAESYLADKRPWVVAYSGGKDSTLVLQLVYEMLLSLETNLNEMEGKA